MTESLQMQGDLNNRIATNDATATLRIYLEAEDRKIMAKAIATGKRDEYVKAFLTVALGSIRTSQLPPGYKVDTVDAIAKETV